MKSINTSDIVDAVANGTDGLTKAQITIVTNLVLANIGDSLRAGDEVRLHNFGAFSVTARAERPGRNPATGAEMTIAASKAVKFKASKALKDKVA